MTSQELGNLFEKASFKILEELFHRWGFQIIGSKIQKSGIQFGFDEFFKITFQNCLLNIYVECKASQNYNEINAIELKDKIEQLEWANLPKKDIHILFSPSREIKFSNRETTIENDKYPFVIMDWTRKSEPVNRNLAMELFVSYRGDNEQIKNYRDFLLTEIDDSFKTTKTFFEICDELKAEFIRRVDEHQAEAKDEEFRIINGAFWQRVQQNTDFEKIHYFYTKIDSTDDRLRQVVANNFYIRNEDAVSSFDIKFSQAIKQRKSLIKILSQGGEGKTTFLYNLAKTLCEENNVIWLADISSNTFFTQIRNKLARIITHKPLVFILDNPASFGEDLERFAEKLTDVFDGHNVVLITAERHFRYQEISERDNFEPLFDEVYDVNLLSKKIIEQVFGKLIAAFQKNDDFSEELIEQSKAVFLQDKNLSIAEKTYALIKFLTTNNKLKGYKFDWQDWEDFTAKNAPKLKNLYLLLATFYQFGNSLNIEFCASFLGLSEVEFPEINIFREHKNLPIYRRGKNLFLRHEKLASWYLEDKMRLENSKHYFKRFLENINTEFTRNLFIWLCIKNKEFKNSEYAEFVDINKRAEILENYIDKNPKELKSRTELSKIYQAQRKWTDAERLLKEYIDLNPIGNQRFHPRTELSKIYQRRGKWKEAEDILLELLKIDENSLQARTELSKIYQAQRKWTDAEGVLLECLKIDKNDLNSRAELSKIYQAQRKWTDAECILLEALKIDEYDAVSLLELGRIYGKNKTRFEEVAIIFKKILERNPFDIPSKMELALLYRNNYRIDQAESLCFEILQDDHSNIFALYQVSRIFRRYKKFRVSIKIAENILLLRQTDLLAITDLIITFTIIHDEKRINYYLEIGEKILEENKNHKHEENFRRLRISSDKSIELIDFYRVGNCIKENKQRFIQSENGEKFVVLEDAVFNYKLDIGDKVFFGLYSKEGKTFADFIEPYFESINDLQKLK